MRNYMTFNVGPWQYKVTIRSDLCDERGTLLMGRCLPDAMAIVISADVQPQARLHVLLHELRHAWAAHFPKPATPEEEADFSATMTASTMSDLKTQGGLRTLMGLLPEGSRPRPEFMPPGEPNEETGRRYAPAGMVDPATGKAPARGGRAQCGRCELIVSDGSVVTSHPRWDHEAKGHVVTRTLYCCHCDHLQTWDEGVYAGAPNGAVVRGPDYAVGRSSVEAFLEEHPEAAGLTVG